LAADEDTPFSRDPDETSRRPPIVARNGLGDLAQILSRLRSQAEFHSSDSGFEIRRYIIGIGHPPESGRPYRATIGAGFTRSSY
jgi:hypothetical protein